MRGGLCLIFWIFLYLVKWWTRLGSNQLPSHCQRDALPIELLAPTMAQLWIKLFTFATISIKNF